MATSSSDEDLDRSPRSGLSVMSLDEEASTVRVSIIDFLKKSGSEGEGKDVFTAWIEMLKNKEISEHARWNADSWFKKCYQFGPEAQKLEDKMLNKMMREKCKVLFDEYISILETLENECNQFIQRREYNEHRQTVFNNYENSPREWIYKAIACVTRERQILAEFYQKKDKVEQDRASIASAMKFQEELSTIEEKRKANEGLLTQLRTRTDDYRELERKSSDERFKLNGAEQCYNFNGSNAKAISHLKFSVRKYEEEMKKKSEEIGRIKTILEQKFKELFMDINGLVERLQHDVKSWQRQFTLQCVELKSNVTLDLLGPRCSQTGRLLYLIIGDLSSWRDALENIDEGMTEPENTTYKEISCSFAELNRRFIQGTFVCCEQTDSIVKTDKKSLPTVAVRILALECLSQKALVKAHFLYEEDINDCYTEHNGGFDPLNLDLSKVKGKGQEFKCGSEVHLKFDGQNKSVKCVFSNLKLKNAKFERPKTKLQVHEEKYRIVFITKIDTVEVWTMSLPLVVTTGAVQGCVSQASVMWQCFSTDVFKLPIENRDRLPWCEVADMLNAKITNLCPRCPLTKDHMQHLKRRLLGKKWQEMNDDVEISLKQFCLDKMEKVSLDEKCGFSFWKWFLANFNLLDKYLLDYWRDGLIEGFISKEEAEAKLKACKSDKRSIFLLRFSDSHITDSQGIKSVFGLITAALLTPMKNPNTGLTERMVSHVDTCGACRGHKSLKDKNLATILKETISNTGKPIYEYLYPGNQSRDEAFSKYYSKGTVVEGYVGVQDALIVDLEQKLCKMSLKGKHKPLSDIEHSSVDDPLSPPPPMKSTPRAPAKKGKRRTTTKAESSSVTGACAPSPMHQAMSPGASSTSSSASMSEDRRANPSQSHPVLSRMLSKNSIPDTMEQPKEEVLKDHPPVHYYHEIDNASNTSGVIHPAVTQMSLVTTAFSQPQEMQSMTPVPKPVDRQMLPCTMSQQVMIGGDNSSSQVGQTQFFGSHTPANQMPEFSQLGINNIAPSNIGNMPAVCMAPTNSGIVSSEFEPDQNYSLAQPDLSQTYEITSQDGNLVAMTTTHTDGDMVDMNHSHHAQQAYQPFSMAQAPIPSTSQQEPIQTTSQQEVNVFSQTGSITMLDSTQNLQALQMTQSLIANPPQMSLQQQQNLLTALREANLSNTHLQGIMALLSNFFQTDVQTTSVQDSGTTQQQNSLSFDDIEIANNVDSATLVSEMEVFDSVS